MCNNSVRLVGNLEIYPESGLEEINGDLHLGKQVSGYNTKMARQSTVYEVLIASPSDVIAERLILSEVLQDWNSAHARARGISLQALRWEQLPNSLAFAETPLRTL